jgi:hypothetical protein
MMLMMCLRNYTIVCEVTGELLLIMKALIIVSGLDHRSGVLCRRSV